MATATIAPDQAATVIARSQRDPVWFFREVLGVAYLTDAQISVIESVRDNRRTAVPAGHSVGKTWLAARIALWFLCSFRGSKVLTTAPTWHQVEHLLWRELRKAHSSARFPLGGTLNKTALDIAEDWFAVGLSTNDPTRFQGIHAPRVMLILDEATGVDPTIWEAGEGIVVGPDDRWLAQGNPTDPTSEFKRAEDSGLWNVIRLSAEDHPNVVTDSIVVPGAVTKEWVEERAREYGGRDTSLYRARVLGLWPEQGDDVLIALAWVEAAQAKWTAPDTRVSVGCDIARFGSDETIEAGVYENGCLRIEWSLRGQDLMSTAGRLKESNCKRLAVDDAGLGGGVTDRLKEQGVPVMPINNGEAALDKDKFVNKRAELWWTLREHLRMGDLALDPADNRLAADLTNVKYGYDSRGRIKIESKDEIRKRLGRSPDRGDASTLAVWAWKDRVPVREFGFTVM